MRKIFALLFALAFAVPAFAQSNDPTRNLYIIDASGHLITLGAPGGMTSNTTITFPTSGGTVLTSAPSGGTQVTNFGSSTSQGDFLLWDANGNSLTFKTVADLGLSGGNNNLIWPKNASGVLTNDGNGNLSWATSSGSVPSTFAKGSLLYGSVANTWSALPGSSTDGWVLTWDAATGLPKWASAASGGSSFGAITLTGASNQINVQANGTGNKYIITGTNPVSGDLTYTIPDAGANASFVMTAGNQTIGGTKTFSSTISGDINGNAATVTNGVYTTGNQSIGGTKTFTNQTVVFDQNGATTGGYTFNFGTPTADNVITFPNSGGELTLMGNTFNGANQLLKLDASGKLPAIDGSALTNLSATNFSSGTVSATRGGTGLSTWTKGSVLYADAANSWAALPGASTNNWVLTWDNTNGVPKWAAPSGGGMANPLTTTGDMIYSTSGSTPSRLGIGTASYVMTVNSGGTAPQWTDPTTLTVGNATNVNGVSVPSTLTFPNVTGTVAVQTGSSGSVINTQGLALSGSDVTNSTTALANTGLTVNIGANETWTFECMLLVNGGNATAKAGVEVGITGSHLSTVKAAAYGTGSSGAGSFTSARIAASGAKTAASYCGANTSANDGFIIIYGTLKGDATGGAVNIQFCASQGSSTPTVSVQTGSYINARKM